MTKEEALIATLQDRRVVDERGLFYRYRGVFQVFLKDLSKWCVVELDCLPKDGFEIDDSVLELVCCECGQLLKE